MAETTLKASDLFSQATFEPKTLEFWAIEGVHGIGKTTIINEFKKNGYTVFNELFSELLPTDEKLTDYDLLFAETKWQWKYFKRLDQYCQDYFAGKIDPPKYGIVIIDRSYLTSALYTDNPSYADNLLGIGELLERKICEKYPIKYNILFLSRLINNEYYDILYKRIEKEEWRKNLNETDRTRIFRFICKAKSPQYLKHWTTTLTLEKFEPTSEEVKTVYMAMMNGDILERSMIEEEFHKMLFGWDY